MAHREDHHHSNTSIIEAVETLTSIADLEIEGPIGIAERHEIELQEIPIIYRTVHWLHRRNAEKVMVVVRDTFRTILNYLKHFYKAEYGRLVHHESVEGIKTIMVLVGEAAKKVDKYSRVFVGANVSSVKESKEFRDLWAFYQRKIAPIAVQESLSKWIHQLPVNVVHEINKPVVIQSASAIQSSRHFFIDLDSVKKDSEYELFLIRKEDGSRFFNPRLLRNIKLVSNFEEYFSAEGKNESIKDLTLWRDALSRHIARNIVRQNWHFIDAFVKVAKKQNNNELVSLLYRAIVALMLAANQGPSVKELSKGSGAYLLDFQRFMRALLASPDYHRIITYPPKNEEAIQYKIVGLMQHFARQLFSGHHLTDDSSFLINELILKGKEELKAQETIFEVTDLSLSSKLAYDYEAILRAMHHYSHVPLLYVIDNLQDVDISGYDPLLLQNLPTSVFDLYPKGKRLSVLRIASPTSQEYIHKAAVTEEFKSFLRSIASDINSKGVLVINMQDRTSLREYARCHAIEDLQHKEEFAKVLSVVSLTKDSDFYHQLGPYQELNHADLFIEQLTEHFQSENSGYYYPAKVKKVLFAGFAQKLASAIHAIFFGRKNVLSRASRLDFIELFYNFIQLKIIETVQPGYVSFSCKDAIDIGMTASCELFFMLKMLNFRPLSEEEQEYLKVLLYGPSICYRGRSLFLERFSRMNSLVKLLEAAIEERGSKELHAVVHAEIVSLFDTDILSAVVTLPQPLL